MAQISKSRRTDDPQQQMLIELEGIKYLLAVLLMKAGTAQSEIAAALQIDQGNLSRVLPARKFKPFNRNRKE